MKSPMITQATYISAAEKKRYSDLQVLHSAAGYYIGTLYTGEDGFVEPGSRDSDYYPTQALAEQALKDVIGETEDAPMLRTRP